MSLTQETKTLKLSQGTPTVEFPMQLTHQACHMHTLKDHHTQKKKVDRRSCIMESEGSTALGTRMKWDKKS